MSGPASATHRTTIDRLIVNSPYQEPNNFWKYDRQTQLFELAQGRRPAGYVIASGESKAFDDPGIFVEIPLVNQIRKRVTDWRERGYPGVTSITKRLLEYWNDPEEFESRRFFFCQLEAMETLIWLTEAPAAERVGIDIPTDGGEFLRLCCKMATGTGKTIVMAMAMAWHILNKVTYPRDTRFARNVLIIAPGLTVKSRLAVLEPAHTGNYYEQFRIIPPGSGLLDKLRQGRVLIRNWHALAWDSEEQIKKRRSVDKRGAKSDEAYTREVLGEMAGARNILVINDEAHHAWRINPEAEGKYLRSRDLKDSAKEATVWIGGLDRLHRTRGILSCLDFSATPFSPSGKKSSDEALFGWVVSDFGLNDAIESGLVKTPRVVVRDDAVPDAKTYKSRLYHIYADPDVKDDLNRQAKPEEPLPNLVVNAYLLLGYDWRETMRSWAAAGHPTPPVMITVCNRTETAARVKHAFDARRILIDELCDPDRVLHIDSKVLKEAEEREEPIAGVADSGEDEENEAAPTVTKKMTKAEQAEYLRKVVDTVGKVGQPGEKIQKVISVGMLSEGWDAKTVTHIMGLRAFSSQLLCEQVVGRGLRRTSYEINPGTGLYDAEYVNIFGVPFTFLPHEGGSDVPPPPPPPKTAVEPDPAKAALEIRWPNIIRIEHLLHSSLTLNLKRTRPLELNAAQTTKIAVLSPILDGKPDVTQVNRIELERLAQDFRYQRIVFETARDVYDQMQNDWRGNREVLLAQLVKLIEVFITSGKIRISPPLFYQDELNRRLIIALNMSVVVQHLWDAIRQENTAKLTPVFDREHPIRSTGEMRTWYTGKPCARTSKSHINVCVYDSTWEASDAFALDDSKHVKAWAKNDHLGFEILYIYRGVVRKYRPDFLIRLTNGRMLVLETKGQDTEQDQVKRRYLDEWIKAVNTHGGFGQWSSAVARQPGEIQDVLMRCAH
jgi:type III restriction enzyme